MALFDGGLFGPVVTLDTVDGVTLKRRRLVEGADWRQVVLLPEGRCVGVVADNLERVDGAIRVRRRPVDVAFRVVRRVTVEGLRIKRRIRGIAKVVVVGLRRCAAG